MSISLSTSLSSPLSSWFGVSNSSVAKSSETTSTEAEFLKEARKTPAERIHDAMLKKLGITEEQFAAMDPASKAKVEQAIRDEIARELQSKLEQGTGLFTDVSV